MRLLRIILLNLAGSLFFGCRSEHGNLKDVSLEIRVMDAATGKPVQGAEVLAASIYDGPGLGTANRDSLIQAVTGPTGLVKVSFRQAFKVAAAVQAPGYLPGRQTLTVNQSVLVVTIPLRKTQPNPTLRKQLYYSLLLSNDKDLGSIYSNDSPKTEVGSPVVLRMNYCYKERVFKAPDTYGIDLSGARTSRDTAVCDVWLAPGSNDSQPTVLIAGGKGGIIPIVSTRYSSSVLIDFDEAPAAGYKKKCVLTGKENGFFIKTRDGNHYSKFFLSGTWNNFSARAHDENEPYCEYRWEGSCLFQSDGSRNLGVGSTSINLLHLLRGNIP